MPVYQISHAFPLTLTQQDALAEAITNIHLSAFPLVPKFFVNVLFEDTGNHRAYIGGKRARANHLVDHVQRGTRTTADLEDLRDRLEVAWEGIVVKPALASLGVEEGTKLRFHWLIINPVNPVGKEAGFEVPLAGEE